MAARAHCRYARSAARLAAISAMPAHTRASVGESLPPHVPGAPLLLGPMAATKGPCDREDPCERRLGGRSRVRTARMADA